MNKWAGAASIRSAATARIYAPPESQWHGRWCIALLNGVSAKQRAAVRQQLGWLGFGQLGADTLAHPHPDRARLLHHLDNLGVRAQTVLLDAAPAEGESNAGLGQLVSQAWDLGALEAAYADYIELFRPVVDALEAGDALSEADAFYIRTFMIHEYRKVVLRDPALPDDLLPAGWKGRTAYRLSRSLYRTVLLPSEGFIDTALQDQSGRLPQLAASFTARFSGLQDLLDETVV
jgi:phenylacetic acid degradation operon negative regulatory protein